MISLKNYKEGLVSDYIKKEYTVEEETVNLMLFQTIADDIEEKYGLDKELNLTYKEFVEEVLADLDLLETSFNDTETMVRVTKLMVTFLFRYLRENFYFDKSKGWLWNKLFSLYEDKNADYNNSAEKQLKLEGKSSFKSRLRDKISRIYSFSINRDMSVNEESKEDTIKDLIGYCMIFLIWYEKEMPRYK